jgi:hypothetical protein
MIDRYNMKKTKKLAGDDRQSVQQVAQSMKFK